MMLVLVHCINVEFFYYCHYQPLFDRLTVERQTGNISKERVCDIQQSPPPDQLITLKLWK